MFFFNQPYNSYLQNLLLNNLQNNNNHYPKGWQQGSGTIEVIEKRLLGYYNFDDNWQYQYVNGKIQAKIEHELHEETIPWLSGWDYRKRHTIVGTTEDPQFNYTMRIIVHYGSGTDSGENVYCNGHCKTDFGDIRFTTSNRVTELDYWLGDKIDSDNATFWVEINHIPASPETVDIYIYYGKTDATTTSNGTDTFPFFDHFDDGILDGNKWYRWQAGGSYSESGTEFTVIGGSSSFELIGAKVQFSGPRAFYVRAKITGSGEWQISADDRSATGYPIGSGEDIAEFKLEYYTTWREGSYTDITRTSDLSSYHVLGIIWKNDVGFYEDDNLKALSTTNIPQDNLGINFGARINANVTVDWCFVKNLCDPEPTHESWGEEQEPELLQPWLSGWDYRIRHTIVGSTAGAQTNYQMKITVHYGSGTDSGEDLYCNFQCREDFGDIRFTKSDGTTLLDYWLGDKIDSDNATFWVEIDHIPASPETVDIYIYYGKTDASTTSNGTDTFILFDHFDDGNIDAMWTSVGTLSESGTSIIASGGASWIYSGSSNLENRRIVSRCEVVAGKTMDMYNFLITSYTPFFSETNYGWRDHCCDDQSNSTYFIAHQKGAGQSSWTATIPQSSGTTYHNYEIIRKSAGTEWLIDGISYRTDDFDPNVNEYIIPLRTWGPSSSYQIECDWVFVAKWAEPEPNHESWGIEEQSDYLLVGYMYGWNLDETSLQGGILVPCKDSYYGYYYWIQPTASQVTITFEANQTFMYNGINIVSGNEPFTIFGGDQTLIQSGDTFKFTPLKQYSNVTDALNSSTKAVNQAPEGYPTMGFENGFTSIEKPTSLNASDDDYYHQSLSASILKDWAAVYLKGYINPADYDLNLTDWRCYKIDLKYEGHAKASGDYNEYNTGFQCFCWGYWDPGTWWWDGSNIPMNDTDQFRGKLFEWSGADFTDKVGLGVRAYCDRDIFTSKIEMWSDHFYGTCYYESRYSSLLYDAIPFNTNSEPYLLIKYRTSDESTWNLYLTSGDNKTAKTIPLSPSPNNWNETAILIEDGNVYDGFYLNSSNWDQWIEFDYILAGHRIEVNSLYPNGLPNLTVSANPSQPINETNPLNISGTIREMDYYYNPTSNLYCTLEILKEGEHWNNYTVNDAFQLSFTFLLDGLYTVKIEPHWEHPTNYDVELNFSISDGKLNNVYYDQQAPSVEINQPTSDEDIIDYGVVWINGTYSDTQNPVTWIIINDTRFAPVEPAEHPHSNSGTFGFMAPYIIMSEFDIEITAQDRWGNINTAIRHVNVTDQDEPTLNITWPDSNDQIIFSEGTICGTYNATGSLVKNITINDTRFTLVSPEPNEEGFYPETGIFVFKATGIQQDENISVQIKIEDQAKNENSTSRTATVVACKEDTFTVKAYADEDQTLTAKIWTKNEDTLQPLIVLVHGVSGSITQWETSFVYMVLTLLNSGYTVVAYDQRIGTRVGEKIDSFEYLMHDLRLVIQGADELYGENGERDEWIDISKIGLVGHSLGSWVVTMAGVYPLNYLGEYQNNLRIIVSGNGPANLYDALTWLFL